MSLKMILVAALALVMVSCGGTGGGGGNAAAQKKSASSSFRAISALGPSIFSSVSLLKKSPRLQAEETVDLTCDSGGGTLTVNSTETSFSLVLKAPTPGCTESNTKIVTPAGGLSMTFTGSGSYDTGVYSFTLAINGGATITTDGNTETFSYSNFSIKIDVVQTGTGETATAAVTITVNGSVTSTADGKQTFDNVQYTAADLQ